MTLFQLFPKEIKILMRKSRENTAYGVTKRAQRFKKYVNLCAVGFIKLCRPNYGELFLTVKIAARRERGVRPVRNGGGELADALAAAVPGRRKRPDGVSPVSGTAA